MMPETTEQGSRERKNLKRINVDSWFGKGSSRLEINDMQDFCTQIGSKLQSTNWFTVMKNRSRLLGDSWSVRNHSGKQTRTPQPHSLSRFSHRTRSGVAKLRARFQLQRRRFSKVPQPPKSSPNDLYHPSSVTRDDLRKTRNEKRRPKTSSSGGSRIIHRQITSD